ncbi:MAG TPA: hypothetical protein VFS00_24150, partial [Polyangiaceae bacterium]|nr:hypothetical protein [Polyangiaceae bacterium]
MPAPSASETTPPISQRDERPKPPARAAGLIDTTCPRAPRVTLSLGASDDDASCWRIIACSDALSVPSGKVSFSTRLGAPGRAASGDEPGRGPCPCGADAPSAGVTGGVGAEATAARRGALG